MKRLLTVGLVSVFLSTLLASIVVATASAVVKPKPWQWTERKAAARLTAMGPTTFKAGEIGNEVYGNVCRGLGRGVAAKDGRHYTRFACVFRVGSTNGSYDRAAILRILPVGSGKACLDVNASATYVFDAERQAKRILFPVTHDFITDHSRICP